MTVRPEADRPSVTLKGMATRAAADEAQPGQAGLEGKWDTR